MREKLDSLARDPPWSARVGNDLRRRQAGKLGPADDLEDALVLGIAQRVGGNRPDGRRSAILRWLAPAALPAAIGAFAEAQLLTGHGAPGTGCHGFVDQFEGLAAIRGTDHSASSPQIAAAFFRRTSHAAVSASALSLRASAFSSSRIRFRSACAPLAPAAAG